MTYILISRSLKSTCKGCPQPGFFIFYHSKEVRMGMKRIFHGWLSLVLMGVVFAISVGTLISISYLLTIFYVAITSIASLVIVYFFCAKCPIRLTSCRHIIVGPLTRFLPQRREGSYTRFEIAATSVAVLTILIFPQFYLINKIPLLISFWVIAVLLFAEITIFICRGCGNRYCPANMSSSMKSKD
jgi:hypothetical protein